MRLWYRTYNLPFRDPFTISKGTKTHQPTLIVALEHLGHVGFGEAPAINYYNISTEQMVADLERKKLFVEKFAFTEPERYWHYLHHLYPANPFLVCALDIAGWDLFGKMKRRPISEFWAPGAPLKPRTDFTIGIDDTQKMVEKMNAKPWPLYKIKLGTDRDIEIITELRKHTDAPFRVDANAAWSVEEAITKIDALAKLGVELVEQPLAKDDWEGMKRLMQLSALPLIADESCVKEEDVEKCAGHFHGINIKLTKCSGITPALRMIEAARKLGLTIMIGSMNETTVGSAAIAHLSGLADYIDADGPMLLAQDLATGLDYNEDGRISTSGEPGLGIQFNPEPYES
ncbi:MAG: dipeptide epimerase [Chitinophagaceae bacterium]|nr:MAG: dipeptide epimerase [Chitinophagaceae bacterium]